MEFDHLFLEFLWVHDVREARSALVEPTRLWERWRSEHTGYSPFGIGLRPVTPGSEDEKLPFETWDYCPPYLPPQLRIKFAKSASPVEPSVFYIPPGRRPDTYAPQQAQPLTHPSGALEITAVTLHVPQPSTSATLRAIERAGVVRFERGEAHMVEVVFDHAQQGKSLDLRPGLPLALRW